MAENQSKPLVVTNRAELAAALADLRAKGRTLGLVPTMGALHVGHTSLVEAAQKDGHATIVTIFVNPTQFAPHEDFGKYPRTLDADVAMLAEKKVDIVFAPIKDAMYPAGFSTYIEPPAVAQPLEGHCRPGHYRGVCTVVLKLFNLIPADAAYFGHKDYQQALVIQHMARDLDLPIRVEVCPTVREADGLALSSRNRYLSPSEREQALAISRALRGAAAQVKAGERQASSLRALMRNELQLAGIERIDYVAVADPESLAELATVQKAAIALIACHVGTTRLIDNLRLA